MSAQTTFGEARRAARIALLEQCTMPMFAPIEFDGKTWHHALPNHAQATLHAMSKAYLYDSHWLALRVSYGCNGVIIPEPDMKSLRKHLAEGYSRRPPDHLLFEYSATRIRHAATALASLVCT